MLTRHKVLLTLTPYEHEVIWSFGPVVVELITSLDDTHRTITEILTHERYRTADLGLEVATGIRLEGDKVASSCSHLHRASLSVVGES